jgi:hypothetical protein
VQIPMQFNVFKNFFEGWIDYFLIVKKTKILFRITDEKRKRQFDRQLSKFQERVDERAEQKNKDLIEADLFM